MFTFAPISDRAARLRTRYREGKPEVTVERLRLITDFYRENEAEPALLKRAKLLRHFAENVTLWVGDDELLVGNISPAYRGCAIFPEYGIHWLCDEVRSGEFDVRTIGEERFEISEESKAYILTTEDYWRKHSVSARMDRAAPDEFYDAAGSGVLMFTPADMCDQPVGHFNTDFDKALRKGFGAVRDEAKAKMKELSHHIYGDDAEKYLFYKAVSISCEAAILFSKRYASLCREKAETASTPKRKEELLVMAESLDRIPENPCENFRDAIQCVLLYQHIMIYESGIHGNTLGRLDQYLWKYLKPDLENHSITPEEAQELMDCFCLKISDICKVWSRVSARNSGGYSSGQHVSVGGQLSDGSDASNPVSYMILQSLGRLKLHEPPIDVRIHSGTPRMLWDAAIATAKEVGGIPTLQNDDVIIPALMRKGIPLEDARNYCIIGCVEPAVSGCEWAACGGTGKETYWNMANALLLAINNGVNPMTGKQAGLPTGYLHEMTSFEEVKEAYRRQTEFFVDWQISLTNMFELMSGQLVPLPAISAMMGGCMEKGMDVTKGGAKYNSTGMSGIGSSNVGDGLSAIKYLVFDTKKYTARELYDALVTDWKGRELMRQEILNRSPHFGNDDPYADELTVWATDIFSEYANKGTGMRGSYRPGLYPVSAHIALGKSTAATPDGRFAGEPLSDGVSPKQGLDKNGPIAVLKSVGKLRHINNGNGTLLNMKFHPKSMEGAETNGKFISMVQTFFNMGGMHLQYNVLSSDTLRAAQARPEDYKDLVIRVAGFSAYFVELYKELQDDLISRTDIRM
jgi:formate C-acetyltransferase